MITTCEKCGGLKADHGEMYAGRGCSCAPELAATPPVALQRDCSASAVLRKEMVDSLTAYMDDLPEDWDNYSNQWKCGYNQARNKIVWLLTGKTQNESS